MKNPIEGIAIAAGLSHPVFVNVDRTLTKRLYKPRLASFGRLLRSVNQHCYIQVQQDGYAFDIIALPKEKGTTDEE